MRTAAVCLLLAASCAVRREITLHAPGATLNNLAIGDTSTYAIELHDPPDCAAVQPTKGALHVALTFRGPGTGIAAATHYANDYVDTPKIETVAMYDGDNPRPFFEGAPNRADVTVRRDGNRRRAHVAVLAGDAKVSLSFEGDVDLCPTNAETPPSPPPPQKTPPPPVVTTECPTSFKNGGALCTPSGKTCNPEGTCARAGQSYCSGAAPSPEILKQLAVPRWVCTPSPKVLGPDGCPLGMPNGGACKPNGLLHAMLRVHGDVHERAVDVERRIVGVGVGIHRRGRRTRDQDDERKRAHPYALAMTSCTRRILSIFTGGSRAPA